MPVHTVDISEIGLRIRLDDEERRDRVRRGLLAAALIGEGIVANATPVDRGEARNAWTVVPTPSGADLFNDAPHAGILELGSRPHRPPLEPILRWVVRKFGTGKRSFEDWSEVEPRLFGIAMAIVRNIEAHGTKPHFMVRNNLGKLTRIAKREVDRMLRGAP